ncbi:Immunogenic protein [Desulfamplus magnetovallimortis]|uniref:Immunogenic protein n=1 Tax=Desulfamplus magnetovallimortis TaxID=1246637 RepID=A0A1W1H5Y0_9BACT|nr:TAXI family TRAP transporter solute-binding subunit [Desulfamplus magnetovallimortis]SLM27857.1 Immunogenic protein [Desulfamplus magnetovallimortis]
MKKVIIRSMLFLFFATIFFMVEPGQVKAEKIFITIGTGGEDGVYYPTGNAICNLVSKGMRKHGIKCSVEVTGGSVYNLNSIAAGDFDLGIVQSDTQYNAYNGKGTFEVTGANKNLRSLFSVYPEPFTLVARADSGIHKFEDLKGKRVNIGNPGSGSRETMDLLMQAFGWTSDDFEAALELKSNDQSKALCDNKVDAIIFIGGHPSDSIKEATTLCDCVMVEVAGPVIDKLVAEYPFYRTATIPGGIYKGADKDTLTFGAGATFVSSAMVSEKVAYNIVKFVFENFDEFRSFHPAFADLKKEDMVKAGLTAPLHDGAVKYYKEAGLM